MYIKQIKKRWNTKTIEFHRIFCKIAANLVGCLSPQGELPKESWRISVLQKIRHEIHVSYSISFLFVLYTRRLYSIIRIFHINSSPVSFLTLNDIIDRIKWDSLIFPVVFMHMYNVIFF